MMEVRPGVLWRDSENMQAQGNKFLAPCCLVVVCAIQSCFNVQAQLGAINFSALYSTLNQSPPPRALCGMGQANSFSHLI
jgi:hypothetical protein